MNTLLSVGVGVVVTVVLIALLFELDVRRFEHRRSTSVLRLATGALIGLFVLIIVARFVQYS